MEWVSENDLLSYKEITVLYEMWNLFKMFFFLSIAVLDLKNVKVFTGEDPNVEATLIIEDEDMFGLGSGTIPVKDLLAQDRLDVDGDMEVALKLAPFIQSL